MFRNFENYKCYQLSISIAVEVIKFSQEVRPFRVAEQIAASAFSISSNIAEGASYKSEKDFARFIGYAHGSAAELSSQLNVLSHIYSDEKRFYRWKQQLLEVRKMLSSLQSTLEKGNI